MSKKLINKERINFLQTKALRHYEKLQQLSVPTKGAMEREKKLALLVAKNLPKRIQLKQIIRDPNKTAQERLDAKFKLAALTRNSSPCRLRNRCSITGRARAYNRLTGLGRHALLELANQGRLPGIAKASW